MHLVCKPIETPLHIVHQLCCLSLPFQAEDIWRSLKDCQRGLGKHGLPIIVRKDLILIGRIRAQPA